MKNIKQTLKSLKDQIRKLIVLLPSAAAVFFYWIYITPVVVMSTYSQIAYADCSIHDHNCFHGSNANDPRQFDFQAGTGAFTISSEWMGDADINQHVALPNDLSALGVPIYGPFLTVPGGSDPLTQTPLGNTGNVVHHQQQSVQFVNGTATAVLDTDEKPPSGAAVTREEVTSVTGNTPPGTYTIALHSYNKRNVAQTATVNTTVKAGEGGFFLDQGAVDAAKQAAGHLTIKDSTGKSLQTGFESTLAPGAVSANTTVDYDRVGDQGSGFRPHARGVYVIPDGVWNLHGVDPAQIDTYQFALNQSTQFSPGRDGVITTTGRVQTGVPGVVTLGYDTTNGWFSLHSQMLNESQSLSQTVLNASNPLAATDPWRNGQIIQLGTYVSGQDNEPGTLQLTSTSHNDNPYIQGLRDQFVQRSGSDVVTAASNPDNILTLYGFDIVYDRESGQFYREGALFSNNASFHNFGTQSRASSGFGRVEVGLGALITNPLEIAQYIAAINAPAYILESNGLDKSADLGRGIVNGSSTFNYDLARSLVACLDCSKDRLGQINADIISGANTYGLNSQQQQQFVTSIGRAQASADLYRDQKDAYRSGQVKLAVGIVISVATAGVATAAAASVTSAAVFAGYSATVVAAASVATTLAVNTAVSAATSVATTGSTRGALKGGLTATLFTGVGQLVPASDIFTGQGIDFFKVAESILLHAAVGCISGELNDESCSKHAKSAAFAKAVNLGTDYINTEYFPDEIAQGKFKVEGIPSGEFNVGTFLSTVAAGCVVGDELGCLNAAIGYSYNYLSDGERRAMNAELDASDSWGKSAYIYIKYGNYFAANTAGITAGVVQGLGEGLGGAIKDILDIDPIETAKLLVKLTTNKKFREDFLESIAEGYRNKFNSIFEDLERPCDNPLDCVKAKKDAGVTAGNLLFEVAGIAAGVFTGGAALGSFAVRSLSKIASKGKNFKSPINNNVSVASIATGNKVTDNFVNTRLDSDFNVDVEAGNPIGVGDNFASNGIQRNEFALNAQEFELLAPTMALRNPIQLNNGSIIDNHGFVYTRNPNGSVTSRVANEDQLVQSGARLDFDNISTATSSQSAIPRNLNEQSAVDKVLVNTQNGSNITSGADARFASGGYLKQTQSIPGPNGSNISVHYQYNASTGSVVDVKIVTPIEYSQ